MIRDSYDIPIDIMAFGEMDRTKRFTFYLTGSRYMRCERPDSDFDFITEDSPECRMFLYSLGFGEDVLSNEEYDADSHGANTNAVVQLVTEDIKIQVQLSSNVAVRCAARDVIRSHLLGEHIKANRDERMFIWNTLEQVLAFKHTGKSRAT
jgi:hypothetical protein